MAGKRKQEDRKSTGEGEKRSSSEGARGAPRKRDRNVKRRKFGGKKVEESAEIESLISRIDAGAPPVGSNPLASVLPNDFADDGRDDSSKPYMGAKLFEHLPLSQRTKRGLTEAKYTHMTAIQRAALPHSLCGRDVLGAAKTGSGKTLAFIIPVIEKLYRHQWGADDGLGAIIISPTRELAYQIFEVLRQVGKHHSLSAGLLIGGRGGVEVEKEHAGRLNILVCTPGRLLQHMDETPNFDASQLQILVLDEADRILDMGFAATLNAIVSQLSKERQTLLFSATQTRSVQDLARLSLVDPEYLAVHAESTAATPARLQQTVMIVPLDEKINMLWSFVKTHLRSKTLVFLSSCKQVKFIFEAFKKLRPGVPIKCLHGRMKQTQRSIVFDSFCETKQSVLFSTDVAARGLDFPSVDWVVQMDCPEDVAMYIHRVGRTARYTASGRSLLFLLPSEEKMLTEMKGAKIPIKVIKANKAKVQSVSGTLASLLSRDSDLKYVAQRAFITYLRSIYLQANKEVFDVTKLPFAEYAFSMGLPTTPRIRFLRNKTAAAVGTGNDNNISDSNEDEELGSPSQEIVTDMGMQNSEGVSLEAGNKKSKLERLFSRKNASILSASHERNRVENRLNLAGSADSDEEFLSKKRPRQDAECTDDTQVPLVNSSGVKIMKNKKLKIEPSKAGSQRLVFDEIGNAIPPLAALAKDQRGDDDISEDVNKGIAEAAGERFQLVKEELKKRDKEDRLQEKSRLREKRVKLKHKMTEASIISKEEGLHPRAQPTIDSDSDVEPWNEAQRKPNGEQITHSSNDILVRDMHIRGPNSEVKRNLKSSGKGISQLSVAEQEAMALRLLASKG